MTIADDIANLLQRKRPRAFTAEDIADMLYGQDGAYPQRIQPALDRLVQKKTVTKQGKGGQRDLFTYKYYGPIIRRR